MSSLIISEGENMTGSKWQNSDEACEKMAPLAP